MDRLQPGNPEAEDEEDRPCWCGEEHPEYAPLPSRCDGMGSLYCRCGGDQCVCHNHGEVDCPGCVACDGDAMEEDDGEDDDGEDDDGEDDDGDTWDEEE